MDVHSGDFFPLTKQFDLVHNYNPRKIFAGVDWRHDSWTHQQLRQWTLAIQIFVMFFFFNFFQLHWIRQGVRLLDLAVCFVETARARRHDFHRAAKTAADLLALVSPYHRPHVLMVFVHGVHSVSTLVCGDELLCSLVDVHLLCTARTKVPPTKIHLDGHHRSPAHPDGRRLCH